jgi:hypothetical protein
MEMTDRHEGRSSAHARATIHGLGWLALACVALCGCRSVPPPPPRKATTNSPAVASSTNRPVTVSTRYPTLHHHFSISHKLNPVWWFGNADEPVAPDWYRPGRGCRNFMWHMRNPFHNFDFYVVGIVEKPFTRVGRFADRISNPNDGWNWAVCRYKRLRLPFIDFKRGGFEFYFGWRTGGAFGIKLNFTKPKEVPPKKAAAPASPGGKNP